MTNRENQHWRDLRSYIIAEQRLSSAFKRFVKRAVLPKLILEGKKLDQKKKIAMQIIVNLVTTGLVGACVSDSRNTHQSGVRLRVAVWDAIIKAGFALPPCLGSEASGRQTLYRATKKLLRMQPTWRDLVEPRLKKTEGSTEETEFPLLCLHKGKTDLTTGLPLPAEERKKPIGFRQWIERYAQPGADGKPHPQAIQNGLDFWKGRENIIARINHSNFSHGWQATSPVNGRPMQVLVELRQIHIGEPFRGARLYTPGVANGGQNLPRDTRSTILIDGEPTTELDFSCMSIRMLYHLNGLDPEGDLYRPEIIMPKFHGYKNVTAAKKEIVRGFIKQATNICLNVKSQGGANSAVAILLKEHAEAKFLQDVIFKVENSNPRRLVKRICKAHPKVKHKFFIQKGIELMGIDGTIMLHILLAFVDAEKPVLPIHDSLVSKAPDAAFAYETMVDKYQHILSTRFEPVIKQDV